MADPEEKGLPAETPAETGTPPEPTDTPVVSEPDATPKPEATPAPEGEEPAKPSLDDFSLDDILERSDLKEHLKKAVQSAGDRAVARAETRYEEKVRQAQANAQAETDAAERQRLVASEDFDEIGRQEVAKSEANERLRESLEQAGEAIAGVTVKQYTQELGEETVERIIQEQNAAGGNPISLAKAFAEEATKKAVGKATESAVIEAERRFDEKLEAFREEQGVTRRSAEAEDTGPVDKISGTPPAAVTPETEKTWETEVDRYNAGDITWEEMEPFQIAHDKETGGQGMRG